MRINPLRFLLLFLVSISPAAWGDELSGADDVLTNTSDVQQQSTVVPLAPRSQGFDDFRHRLETALASRDPLAIRALYRINGVVTEAFKLELARWQQRLSDSAEARVSLIFKELLTLPPKAREDWTAIARQRTKGEVTHLVGVCITPDKGFTLFPLLLIDDRLWIVPSDTISNTPNTEPGQFTRTPTPSQGR